MKLIALERCLTAWISWLTALTGAAQMLVPSLLLPLLGITATAEAAHLFVTVGMFMVLFGGALVHALRVPGALPLVLYWSAWQKLGAAVLVGLGVWLEVFAPVAWLVAAFDFATAVLYLDLGRRLALARQGT
ncbi:hypothetical protein ED236_05825 [Pseudomethylobacillus aquaticus]|uniref:Uncharacterized protein n=1 Tax=Pseudomethylobacillus aquaticus TaxID=2676064 RepID=A0A3N0V331_9PROT|nr:hypothetical protein [Pseudomethylobacillus aquaticus]ROH87190.1 hypothetical protein ED236_05825 [Pseudomethylobacillus aquaticus]